MWARLRRSLQLVLVVALLAQTSVFGGVVSATEATLSPDLGALPWPEAMNADSSVDLRTSSASSGALAGPSPVALGVYQPSFPNDLSRLTEHERRSGRKFPLVHWYALWGGWKGAFDRADFDAVAARGSVPLVTWEPWSGSPSDTQDPTWSLAGGILAGRYDAYIDSWARGLSAYGRPVFLRFAHEMHHTSLYPWAVGVGGNTAEQYVAAWKRVRAIFARYPTSNVIWVWSPNSLGDAPASAYAPVYRSVYPGDDQVDWLGLDVYNTGPMLSWGAPRWRSVSEALGPMYDALTAISPRPLLLAEVGSTEVGGSKPDWITSALGAEVARFPRVRALVWFDVNKEQPWNLDSSPGSLQAWVSATRLPQVGAGVDLLSGTA
jgi:hypothetical protein